MTPAVPTLKRQMEVHIMTHNMNITAPPDVLNISNMLWLFTGHYENDQSSEISRRLTDSLDTTISSLLQTINTQDIACSTEESAP